MPDNAVPGDPPEVLARIEEGLQLVHVLAHQMRRHFGNYMTVDELASHGHEALVVAARSFDAQRGPSFRRWANIRIRGAMLDAVRMRGNLPKRVWQKLRAVQAADAVHDAALEEHAAAPPATAEDADAKLSDQLATAAMAMAISFLTVKTGGVALERARDPNANPEEAVGHAELLARIRAAIAARPEPERVLLTRHYFEEVSLEDAGKELGLSKSWASRLHTRALESVAKVIRSERTKT
jgi:RNA polymerase sigma factor for flagellar operon FliA